MAKRLSVQEMLEAARRGGSVQPSAASPVSPEPSPPTATAAQPVASASAIVPSAQSLGRPLTMAEKMAAARGGAAPTAQPVTTASMPPEADARESVKSVPPPAPSLGRPLSMAEKLAAARGGPAASAGGAAAPAAAHASAPAAKVAATKRVLPALDKISDPKDLAEALRQTGARKDQALAAASVPPSAAAKPTKEKESRPQSVLPRPSKASGFSAAWAMPRRAFTSVTTLIIVGWVAFVVGVLNFNLMLVRFMFPNVLAEPPSSIKIGLPTDYEADAVNERFKSEWGFWVVRSARYNGQDILYALQSVCTHLGCPPNWLTGEQKFKCPCHGSGFYISGINFEGPAPRPLERFKLSVADDGQLLVDKSQKFQEELGQWSDPDSFVSA